MTVFFWKCYRITAILFVFWETLFPFGKAGALRSCSLKENIIKLHWMIVSSHSMLNIKWLKVGFGPIKKKKLYIRHSLDFPESVSIAGWNECLYSQWVTVTSIRGMDAVMMGSRRRSGPCRTNILSSLVRLSRGPWIFRSCFPRTTIKSIVCWPVGRRKSTPCVSVEENTEQYNSIQSHTVHTSKVNKSFSKKTIDAVLKYFNLSSFPSILN